MKFKSRINLVRTVLIILFISFLYLSPLLLNQNYSIHSQKDINKVNIPPYISSSNDLWSYSTEGVINSVAISSDGNYIVAGSTDKKIYLFEKFSPTPLWQFDTDGMVTSVAISSDGNYIVAGSSDEKVYFFNKTSSIPIWEYKIDDYISSVAISFDGSYIVVGSYDDEVLFFNKLSSTPLWHYSTEGAVISVSISFDGNFIVVGSIDDGIYIFNRISSIPLWHYSTGADVRSVAISSDGTYITAGSNDNRVYLFNKSSSTPLWDYSTEGDVRSVSISSDGAYITTGSYDNRVYLFNKSSSIPLWDYSTEGDIISVAISLDGSYTVVGSMDWNIILLFNYPLDHITLITNAGSPDVDGKFNLIWTSIKNADNYSIYYDTSYIYEINESITLLKSNITTNSYSIEGFSKGEYYFKIVAYLKTGNFSSNCIFIKIGSTPPNLFDQIFLFVIIPITVGIVSISSSVGAYYAVRKYKQKKLLFEISDKTAVKPSLKLIEEIKKDTPFIKNYVDTNYQYEEVPKISDYIFSRLSLEEIKRIDLIELSNEEKKRFIKEILNLEPQERKQLIDDMLKNQE